MLEKIKFKAKKILIAKGIIKIKKNSSPIKWGIIGLGNMAEVLASTIDGNKNAIVHAVASRSLLKATAFANRHGKCKTYGSYEEMIHDSEIHLDIIYIATPVILHYEILKTCLLAGKNVICEKPITTNSKQFNDLIEIAKQNNCFLMEAMWMKCLPTFQKAFEWINEEKIGNLELIKADFYKNEHKNPESTIYNSKEGGGVLLDYGIYAISFMTTFLKGVPETLNFSKRISTLGVDSDWQISTKNKNVNAFINISSNFSSQSKAALIGEKGSIEWDSQFNRTHKITLFDAFGNKIEEYASRYVYQGFEFEVDEVTRCLKDLKKESQLVPLNETLDTLTVIDQLISK
ncbi:MAG: Gfo/Idh/MocA family oxidoreductase [Polaribacter sp.]|uniref:Gfo/Idh/MocA family protein n=1 Tax=Polaribacter sp. TaxID=1920175 RepID=UPI003BB118D6